MGVVLFHAYPDTTFPFLLEYRRWLTSKLGSNSLSYCDPTTLWSTCDSFKNQEMKMINSLFSSSGDSDLEAGMATDIKRLEIYCMHIMHEKTPSWL